MTPEELLAACREAWPAGPGSDWEVFDEPLQVRREVWRLLIHVERVYVFGAILRATVPTLDALVAEAPATPEGAHIVATALRSWCRDELRKLAEAIDPPEATRDPRTLALSELRNHVDYDGATEVDALRFAPPKGALVEEDGDDAQWRVLSDFGDPRGHGQLLLRNEVDGEECWMTPKPDRWTIVDESPDPAAGQVYESSDSRYGPVVVRYTERSYGGDGTVVKLSAVAPKPGKKPNEVVMTDLFILPGDQWPPPGFRLRES